MWANTWRSELCEHVFEVAETKSLLNVVVIIDDVHALSLVAQWRSRSSWAPSSRPNCKCEPSLPPVNHRHGERVKAFRKDDVSLPANPPSHHTAKVTKNTVDSFVFEVVPHPPFFSNQPPPLIGKRVGRKKMPWPKDISCILEEFLASL